MGGLFAIAILVDVGILIMMIHAATRFFAHRADAPAAMIRLILAQGAATAVCLMLGLMFGDDDFAGQNGLGLFRTIVSGVIWIPYFKLSKRVKATFVK